MVRNPYCWTIEHQKDLLEKDDQNLSKGKLSILCGIRKVYLNYYFTEDGNWRFYDRTYFIYENTRRLCFDIEEHETWSSKFNQMVECLYVPLMYQLEMVQDIKDKALLIVQENDTSKNISIIIDIVHRIPQTIANLYQDHDHEEANEDELGLIEEQVVMNLMTLEETRVFVPVIPTSKDAIEELEKVKVETLNVDKSFGETCMICLGKLLTKDIVELTRMPCKHMFHGDCIIQWLEKNHVCPLCRFRMPIDKEN
uniref:RING-type E3 ubiquitin transferase n=1 Tax=Solanum tuberosum TaxID=4113 RepID=M1DFZ1_SOLTU